MTLIVERRISREGRGPTVDTISECKYLGEYKTLTGLIEEAKTHFGEHKGSKNGENDIFLNPRMKKLLAESQFEGRFQNLMRLNPIRLRNTNDVLYWNLIYQMSRKDLPFFNLLPYAKDLKLRKRRYSVD